MVGLGHGEAASDLAAREGGEPAGALGRGAVLAEELHVAGVGGLAVEDVMAEGAAAEGLADVRELDMQASPYDLAELGYEPVPIETPDGRAEYVRRQAAFAERARLLRERLVFVCRSIHAVTSLR